MADDTQPRKLPLGFLEALIRVVGRSIVHIDDLELRATFEGGVNLLKQRNDVLRLVLYRHNDAQHGSKLRRPWQTGPVSQGGQLARRGSQGKARAEVRCKDSAAILWYN